MAVDGQANIPWDVQHPASPHSCLLRVQPQVRAIPLGPPIYEIRIWVLFRLIWSLRYSTGRGRPQMARTWFGEIGPCCCLPPLLNLPAAFSQPRANHKGVPSRGGSICPLTCQLLFRRGRGHLLRLYLHMCLFFISTPTVELKHKQSSPSSYDASPVPT